MWSGKLWEEWREGEEEEEEEEVFNLNKFREWKKCTSTALLVATNAIWLDEIRSSYDTTINS